MNSDNHIGKQKLWLALLPAMLLPLIGSFFYFVLLKESLVAQLTYGGIKVFTLVWPIFCLFFIFRSKLPNLELRSPRHKKAIVPGMIMGIIVFAVMLAIMESPAEYYIEAGAPSIRAKILQLGIEDNYWLFAFFLSFIHSLLEEYYWRWFVYGYLRKLFSIPIATVLAGLSFAAHHVVIAAQYFGLIPGILLACAVALGGIIWCLMYEKQGTLVGAWVSHIVIDIAIMTIGYGLVY